MVSESCDHSQIAALTFAVVSESSNHSRIATLTCIDFVITEVERHTSLTKIIIWSGGCAAQFRSRFVFKLLANYRRDLQIEWNYNEAHHGKGPMDGMGYLEKSGRVIINSAEEFSVAANKFFLSIATQFKKICSASLMKSTYHFLSTGKEPCHTQSYLERKCGHVPYSVIFGKEM